MRSIAEITQNYLESRIKDRDLENIIFEEVYRKDRNKMEEVFFTSEAIRKEFLEKATGADLSLSEKVNINNGRIVNGMPLTGIEKKFGAASIPMGFAGPALVNGDYAKGEFYLPLATNEAALVAGLHRGLKAINMAGGLNTIVVKDGMARAPMVEAPTLREAHALARRAVEDEAFIRDLGSVIKDPFVRLEYIEPYQIGKKVGLRLVCKTGDAMGMNGVTKAAADISRRLLELYPTFSLMTISSNLCSDKKSSHINMLNGRGKSVHSHVFIPEEVLQKVFKKGVTSRSIEKVVFNKCYLGSALSGTLGGFNINAANAVAAFYAATGQDLAHIVSSSTAFIVAEAVEGGLNYSVSMPTVEVATIGGGTGYGTAREMLRLLGCDGIGKSVDDSSHASKLAELCITAVTALDLNTSCAQAAGYEMADSHVALARGEK